VGILLGEPRQPVAVFLGPAAFGDVPDDAEDDRLVLDVRPVRTHFHGEPRAVPPLVERLEAEPLGGRDRHLFPHHCPSIGDAQVVHGAGEEILPGVAVGGLRRPVGVQNLPVALPNEEQDVRRRVGEQPVAIQPFFGQLPARDVVDDRDDADDVARLIPMRSVHHPDRA
jgi:hypothetical protein